MPFEGRERERLRGDRGSDIGIALIRYIGLPNYQTTPTSSAGSVQQAYLPET